LLVSACLNAAFTTAKAQVKFGVTEIKESAEHKSRRQGGRRMSNSPRGGVGSSSAPVIGVHPETPPAGNRFLESPLKKWDLVVFTKGYQIPPQPPFSKEGSLKEFPDEN
jgi:hypothetical protein